MQPTTEKITVSQSDYNNLADWAKPSYQVQTQTAPTLNQTNNQIQQTQPQASLAITPQSLQQAPQIKIPSIKNTDTTSAGIVASTQPSVQTAQENYNQVQQAAGTQAQDAQSALQRMAENIFGQKADAQSNQVNLENLAGIQEQLKAVGEINTSIASEQTALRGQQEKVRQGYATEAQKQISNDTLNDTYGRRLADLAIRQSAANQNITSIRENAERQTKLLTAPLDTKILYLSTFGKDNVDFLTKEQQNKLAFISDDLKTQKADITALQNAKTAMITEIAQNGGGTNQALIKQIQDAKDAGTVTSIGASSGFIGKTDRAYKQAQTANIYSEINKRNADAKATSVSNTVLNNPQYAGALNVILGSEKFTKEQKTAVVNAVNTGQDPVQVIKNQAKNVMGQTEATALGKLEAQKSATLALQDSLNKYYAAGGKTNIFKGNLESVINKLGEVQDPKLVELAVETSLQLQAYKNAITGTAAGVQESKDISAVFPGINKSSGLNQAIINGKIKAYDGAIDGTYRSTLGSTYDQLKPKAIETTITQPTNPFSTALGQGQTVIQNTIFDPTKGYILPTIKTN